MNIALNTAESYWTLLKYLSNDVKIELIAKLSNSLVHRSKERPISASRFYGVWSDSDFKISSDELVAEIKAGRKFKNDIEAF